MFLLSFRQRDELAAIAERAGWRPIAARRLDGVGRRFVASGASMAVVDARGAFADGLAGIRALADTVQSNAGALLALVSRQDVARLDQVLDAGATHYLASPFGEAELGQALRFADRHAERLAGGYRAALGRASAHAHEEGQWRWRPGSGSVTVNPALARELGSERTLEWPLRVLVRRLGARGLKAAREAVRRLLLEGEATAFAHVADGHRRAHHLHAEGDLVVGRIEDLDDGKRGSRPTSRDPMTGLADGHASRRWIDAAIAGGSAGPILVMLSVSRFEIVNAAFGRPVGDALLKIAARRIERLAAASKRMIARVAGAEFVVALPGSTTLAEARLLGRELVDAIRRPFVAGDHVVTLAAHVGIAEREEADRDAGTLLRRASAALIEAKAGESGSVRVLSAREEGVAARENRLEIDLRAALDHDEIEILFQPQVAVTTGQIVGVEALARWRHPQLGELGAVTLFAAAERSEYVRQLSEHVQNKALAEISTWSSSLARLRVSLNVTAADIAQGSFADVLLGMIDAGGIDRQRITVEVTESGLIEDLNNAAALLAKLRAGGLRVAIDDFGTGYSSLAYLKALPLDYLKIDKRLSQDIAGTPRDRVVVRGVIDMARSLGLTVIAEGVETREQLALLAEEGCNIYQGFLCAPPLDRPALEALLGRQRRDGLPDHVATLESPRES